MLWFTGELPKEDIDHLNGKRDDNRIENLRSVSRKENCKNRRATSKQHLGVYFLPQCTTLLWEARLTLNKKIVHRSLHETYEEAVAARKEVELKYGFTTHSGPLYESSHSLRRKYLNVKITL